MLSFRKSKCGFNHEEYLINRRSIILILKYMTFNYRLKRTKMASLIEDPSKFIYHLLKYKKVSNELLACNVIVWLNTDHENNIFLGTTFYNIH